VTPRLAIVGCGAVARAHARALAALGVACTAVHDVDRRRAEALRRAVLPGAAIVDDLASLARAADAAVVAVPTAFHASVATALLDAGLHVLCEKPLAPSRGEAERMVAAAERARRVLACGLVRRFHPSTGLVSRALLRGLIGPPRRVTVYESAWNWPWGRSAFDLAHAGGGVFIDLAPHALDLLALWLGPLELVEYRDDAAGGVEALAVARLRCGGGVEAELRLTRAWAADSRTRIEGDEGFLELSPHHPDRVRLGLGRRQPFESTAVAAGPDPFVAQASDFVAAITGGRSPAVPAADAVAGAALIEEAYRRRQPLRESVLVSVLASAHRKVLVTGATGAVGSRLVELWAAEGRLDQLRCTVRGYHRASRVLRFPVETVEADLRDEGAVRRAAQGCDAIVHLAAGERARDETRSVVAAARALGIRRLVHMSSAAVYGIAIPATVEARQEETPLRRTGEPYADGKAAAERVVRGASDLEALILRPHIVYGPGLRWTGELLALLARDEACLVEDGGWTNLVHVDDLVGAVGAALRATRGFGRPVFITDGVPRRWRDYILAHAALTGTAPREHAAAARRTRRSPAEWLRASVRPLGAVLRSREFRALVRESPALQATAWPAYLRLRGWAPLRARIERLRDAPGEAVPAAPCHELWTALQLSQARLSPARAQELLGFRARVDFADGLRQAAEWFAQRGVGGPGPEEEA
jgi:predicted dehydrogenase/nucleoside-diphosphate-sugar epimerase